MAKTDGLSFGSVVIEGRKYYRDVLILVDGTVRNRRGGSTMFGSHEITE